MPAVRLACGRWVTAQTARLTHPTWTLHEPVLREPDPNDASLERRYRPITEFDGRVLRVVVNTRLNRCAW